MSGLRYEDLRRGNYDGAEHLKDMDIDGTYASVCYPGMGPSFYVHPDKEVAAAGFLAYNDWILDDFQAANPKRLCGVAIAPTELGIDFAVSRVEARRQERRAGHVHSRQSFGALQPSHALRAAVAGSERAQRSRCASIATTADRRTRPIGIAFPRTK